jgi:hypothetical protein
VLGQGLGSRCRGVVENKKGREQDVLGMRKVVHKGLGGGQRDVS